MISRRRLTVQPLRRIWRIALMEALQNLHKIREARSIGSSAERNFGLALIKGDGSC